MVAQSIRGLSAGLALAELQFSNKRIAQDVKKVLEAAIANAENNHDLDVDRLVVSEAFVGKAMVMKRWRPARPWSHRQIAEALGQPEDCCPRSRGDRIMGHKVNPIGLRVGINRTWDSRWYADAPKYADLLHEDLRIREFMMKELAQASVAKVVVERPAKKARVTIHTARPGVVIGKKGQDIEKLKAKLQKLVKSEVQVNIVEIRKPEVDAKLVADNIAQQLERRVSFRRAMKRGVQSAMRMGALGIRVNCAGRLGGAEIARTEWYREGRVPLHTLRADIDYGTSEAIHHLRDLRHEGLGVQGRNPGTRPDGL